MTSRPIRKNISLWYLEFLKFCSFINRSTTEFVMGGGKKQSPAQAEKSQAAEAAKKDGGQKKGDRKDQKSKANTISVIIDEGQAMNFIKGAKVFTVQELSRQTNVKISAANALLQGLLKKGTVKRVGGYSGHHVYVPA
jgi:small subunit ribosomal protein S25e